jgi:hypothetical protein
MDSANPEIQPQQIYYNYAVALPPSTVTNTFEGGTATVVVDINGAVGPVITLATTVAGLTWSTSGSTITLGISGWKLLWQRINPFTETPRMPNLMSHHMSCMAVNFIHYNKSIMHQADLVLISPVVQFGVFEFTAVDDIIKVGYDAIKMQLNSWRKAGGQLPPHTVFE